MGMSLHASAPRGHLHIRTQQVQTFPKGPRAHLTGPSREGVPPAHLCHMSMKHQSSMSTVLLASPYARVPPPALRLNTFPARINCRNTMSQIRVQITTATHPLPSRRLSLKFRYHKRSRRLALEQQPTPKATTQCCTLTELRITRTTSTIINAARPHSAHRIMALADGPRMVAWTVVHRHTRPPTTPPLPGPVCILRCPCRVGVLQP